MADLERRAAIELRASGNKIEGYAAVFGKLSSDLGGFIEKIEPGAFTRSLAGKGDVVALYDHDPRNLLGRTSSGTLHLAEDSRGLEFSLDVPNTSLGRDVLELVGRGDVRGASFAFRTAKGGDRWTKQDGKPLRILSDLDLFDVTITPQPAYPDTTIARRSLSHIQSFDPLYFFKLRLRIIGGQNELS